MTTGKRKGKGGYGDGDNGEPQGPGKHHGGDPVRIHEDYVRHHLSGGAPATPEDYERATKQFNKLRGALRVPTTKTSPPPRGSDRDDEGSQPDDEPETPPS